MASITVLGAGVMGSALAMVAAHRGHDVRLWGTWLDDAIVDAIEHAEAHPRLGVRLPARIAVFRSGELDGALDGADMVLNGVTSEGALPVLSRAWSRIPPDVPVVSVSKGFLADEEGRITRISEAVAGAAQRAIGRRLRWVHVGGPSKALELARGVPTAVVYASHDADALADCVRAMQAEYYFITPSADLAGVEACSALKNAYAIASGICDGLMLAGRSHEMHNTKAALFTQAVREMYALVGLMGGDPLTTYSLPGAGDLLVTAVAGRNRRFGEMIGLGAPVGEVVATLASTDELTEGYPAIRTSWALVGQLAGRGRTRPDRFPLLRALHGIAYEGMDAIAILEVLPEMTADA